MTRVMLCISIFFHLLLLLSIIFSKSIADNRHYDRKRRRKLRYNEVEITNITLSEHVPHYFHGKDEDWINLVHCPCRSRGAIAEIPNDVTETLNSDNGFPVELKLLTPNGSYKAAHNVHPSHTLFETPTSPNHDGARPLILKTFVIPFNTTKKYEATLIDFLSQQIALWP